MTKDFAEKISDFQERLRLRIKQDIPKLNISFESGNLVEQVISLGSNNPIEMVILGKNLQSSRDVVNKLLPLLAQNPHLRDVQLATPTQFIKR